MITNSAGTGISASTPDGREADTALDLLTLALPYLEEIETDPAYKPGHVKALTRRIRAVIERAP